MEVHVLELTRFRRSFQVLHRDAEAFAEYRGDGPGYESVFVDGYEAVRQRSLIRMSPRFDFEIHGRAARFELDISWGANLLAAMWPGHFKRFSFFIDNSLVYEDRRGQTVPLRAVA